MKFSNNVGEMGDCNHFHNILRLLAPSTFTLTKGTMQTQSSHRVRTAIGQHGEQ